MDNKERKIGLVLSYLLIVIQTIVGLLYVPILLKYLGQNEYGLYQLMGSIVAYFSIMDFGISNALISFYSKYMAKKDYEKMENLLYTARRMYNIIILVAIPIALIFYFNIGNIFGNSLTTGEVQESKLIFLMLIVNIIITLKTNLHTSVITAHEKFVFLKLATIIQVILQPILIVLLLSFSPYAFVVTLIQTCLNLLLGIVKVIYTHKKIHVSIKFHYWDKEVIKGLLKLSLSVFFVSIIDQIFWKTNQFILGIISGTAAVAVYSIASQIYTNYMPLSTTLQGVFLPHITKRMSTSEDVDQYANDIFFKIGRIQFIVLFLVLIEFIIFGKDFITLWAGDKYIVAYYIAICIMIPFTFDLIENTAYIFMQVKNIYNERAILYTVAAILNLILAIIFAKKWGALGCGVATGLCMILMNVIFMNIYYKIKLNLNVVGFFIELFKLSIYAIPSILISIAFRMFVGINSWKMFIVGCGILAILYLVSIYFGLNSYEKEYVIKVKDSMINKIKKKG